MQKLFKGVLDFKRDEFEKYKGLFSELERQQNPHTLFIGCSDSRVVPTLITRTNPGELFLMRNIANIVPPYDLEESFAGTSSIIEYAVLSLAVDSIVVCGHSNCGGCHALYMSESELESMPHLKSWLNVSQEVPLWVDRLRQGDSHEEREWLTEKLNILVQMKNLLTYPFIAERVAAGTLKILGWYYIIQTGEVFNFNDEKGQFELVE